MQTAPMVLYISKVAPAFALHLALISFYAYRQTQKRSVNYYNGTSSVIIRPISTCCRCFTLAEIYQNNDEESCVGTHTHTHTYARTYARVHARTHTIENNFVYIHSPTIIKAMYTPKQSARKIFLILKSINLQTSIVYDLELRSRVC